MRIAVLTGLVGGIIVGSLHALTLILGEGNVGAILYNSPLFVFLLCIYFAIKRTKTVVYSGEISFKQALKVGGVTAAIMAFLIGIGAFIGLTHMDVRGQVGFMLRENMTSAEISTNLGYITRQNMFDRAKNLAIPYFLIGFLITVGVSVFAARKKHA